MQTFSGFENGRRCSMDVLQEKVGPNDPKFLWEASNGTGNTSSGGQDLWWSGSRVLVLMAR